MSNLIKDLRMQLSPEEIKKIMASFGVSPVEENETEIIFPTACHNLAGGSPKLYYYLDEKIFKCYTNCNSMFDIFDLLIKMKKLRGDTDFNLPNAIDYAGLSQNESKPKNKEMIEEIQYLKKLNSGSKLAKILEDQVKILDLNILKNYPYNEFGVRSWLEEGISREAMEKFRIGYDSYKNAITIPNFDNNGNLIGIRARFLNKNSIAKYMPLKHGGDILSHPTGKFLYGFFENKETIKKKGIAILFEGEKSVLKMESMYPGNNVALATTGKKITLHHLNSLLSLNVREVILAYDKDYTNRQEMREKFKEYQEIIDILSPYFDTSIIIDEENLLEHKDSPIDKTREIFEKLMIERFKR